MIYPTFGDDWRRRWLHLGGGNVLHRVKSIEAWDDGGLPIGGEGETACRRRGRLAMPGIMSRMYAPRCVRCCKAVGIPTGYGAPVNDKTLTAREVQL